MRIHVYAWYLRYRYNICSAWFLDIRISTCLLSYRFADNAGTPMLKYQLLTFLPRQKALTMYRLSKKHFLKDRGTTCSFVML